MEFEPELEQMHDKWLANLRVFEWLHDLPVDIMATFLTIQDVNQTSITTTLRQTGSLQMVFYVFTILSRSARFKAIDWDVDGDFVRRVEVGLTHSKNLMIKKIKSLR